MRELRRTRSLTGRLAAAILTVAMISLTVLFVGTIGPHVVADVPAVDPVSLGWLLAAAVAAAVIAVLLSAILARRMTRPVDGYIEVAKRFAAGDHSARPADLGPAEFHDLIRALIAVADEIERSETARRHLTADIAHELRTPLAALQAGLEELRDGLVEPDHATLAALHDQATRLGRIVTDLGELSAAESTGLELRRERVDLAGTTELALAAREGSMASAGLVVERDLTPGVVVLADGDRLHQVIGNLLANTVLYCERGDRVVVSTRAENGSGVLEVADSGPGFGAHELPHVFDRSWRGASSDGTRGSGLGLPIVRALVRAQGGSVDIDSLPGRGATIRVRLPRAQ